MPDTSARLTDGRVIRSRSQSESSEGTLSNSPALALEGSSGRAQPDWRLRDAAFSHEGGRNARACHIGHGDVQKPEA